MSKNTISMNKFHLLPTSDTQIDLPDKIKYPFNYSPHPIAIQAADVLKKYISESPEILQHFVIDPTNEKSAPGKMFGVLVCENQQGEVGFLAGFSGKLGETNTYDYFVPSVYDILHPDSFYLTEAEEITEVNLEILAIEERGDLKKEVSKILAQIEFIEDEIENGRQALKISKQKRDELRLQITDKEQLKEIDQQSATENIQFKWFKKYKLQEIVDLKKSIELVKSDFNQLKEKRSALSCKLQLKIFQEFRFLNAHHQEKDLDQLFTQTLGVLPPAGAGECAAPKLFQYAYKNDLKPIALAEFWWGQSPRSEILKHGLFYSCCKGKCEPILSHMLQGLSVEENPLLLRLQQLSKEVKTLDIIYEDDYVVAIHKVEGFLSVPGNIYTDSVLTRLEEMYPDATGPLLLHRLDMSTSGILLAAKVKKVHQILQQQFIDHTIIKRYDAILDGALETNEGTINLPLRGDLNDRPRQLVCYEHGKEALTKFQKIKSIGNYTYVHFWPVTGRTHQLRMHASHEKGLNIPILGDDLYGRVSERLFLHAGYIDFYHPILKKRIVLEVKADFEKWNL